ncbi:MAG: hypothetical protein HY364_04575 [Candidatus Aenigmarchaeota archaeon]|nr:hypothetical protein [Candidatus Aenigmarchaeota archaeon]
MGDKIGWLERLAGSGAYDTILMDSSVISINTDGASTIRDAKNLRDINPDDLDYTLQELDEHLAFLNSDISCKIYTIPEVVAEFGRLKSGIDNHYKLINTIEENKVRRAGRNVRNKRKKYRRRPEVWDAPERVWARNRQVSTEKKETSEQYTLFRYVQDAVSGIENALGGRLIPVVNPGTYEDLKAVVNELSEAKSLKKPYAQGFGRYDYTDLHTDEAIISMAIYLAVFEGRSVGVATEDFDLARILTEACRYWNAIEASEGIEGIDFKLKGNPVILMQYNAKGSYGFSTNEMRSSGNGICRVYSDNEEDMRFRERCLDISRKAADYKAAKVA